VEGFLSLDEAAEKLGTNTGELAREIAEGRVVAVVKNSRSWISPGEVRRLGRSRANAGATTAAAPPVPPPASPEPPAAPPAPEPAEERTSQTDRSAVDQKALEDLQKRCDSLARRNEELEAMSSRLKTGIGETEAALRRSRNAKQNLENDVISLTEQLKKAQTRSSALEREVQHLSHELERNEEQYANDMRRFRHMERGSGSDSSNRSEVSPEDVTALRQQMHEKDRIISQEYQERAVLRAQLEERSQKYFELKAKYEKEKAEWSEILARELQTHGHLKSQLEEMNIKANTKTWNPFRRDR
jgi:DNA repair exonuclease SbcCD ATPase subunit